MVVPRGHAAGSTAPTSCKSYPHHVGSPTPPERQVSPDHEVTDGDVQYVLETCDKVSGAMCERSAECAHVRARRRASDETWRRMRCPCFSHIAPSPLPQSKEGSINRQEALAACATWKHMINTQQTGGGGGGCLDS